MQQGQTLKARLSVALATDGDTFPCPLEACGCFLRHDVARIDCIPFSGEKDQKNKNPKVHRSMGAHGA